MLGIRYFKASPTTFVMQHVNGQVKRQGTGLSFFYFSPSTTLVTVPVGSTDVPFIFNETTADFQTVSIQGHLTYRVTNPEKLSSLLDFSVGPEGKHRSEDVDKLPLRITLSSQNAIRGEIQRRTLRTTLVEVDAITRVVLETLKASAAIEALGVEIVSFSVLAIKPLPETSKALEAEAREKLLREADDAIYSRRNNAVEKERVIRENELMTEVAVQEKQREIDETRLQGQIALEEQRRQLVASESDNAKIRADTEAYAVEATLKHLRTLDPKALQVLAARSVDPKLMVAMAFQDIAANAAKVGNLNISPDLLETLLERTRGNGNVH